METSTVRFSTFPRTEPPPAFVEDVVAVFRTHEGEIATEVNEKGLKSDEVLAVLGPDLAGIGFEVQASKKRADKLERPVFFGENGIPTLRYEIDAYHQEWKCGLEVEAGRVRSSLVEGFAEEELQGHSPIFQEPLPCQIAA